MHYDGPKWVRNSVTHHGWCSTYCRMDQTAVCKVKQNVGLQAYFATVTCAFVYKCLLLLSCRFILYMYSTLIYDIYVRYRLCAFELNAIPDLLYLHVPCMAYTNLYITYVVTLFDISYRSIRVIYILVFYILEYGMV